MNKVANEKRLHRPTLNVFFSSNRCRHKRKNRLPSSTFVCCLSGARASYNDAIEG